MHRVVISGDRFLLDRALVRQRLTAAGFKLTEVPGQSPREEHCAALAQGDLALAYCPEPPAARYPLAIKPALKFANAASFGVPFVAWPEPALGPFADAFAAVRSLDELIAACCRLRDDPVEYARLVAAGLAAAEPFHIDRVAAAWRALLPT